MGRGGAGGGGQGEGGRGRLRMGLGGGEGGSDDVARARREVDGMLTVAQHKEATV